MKINRGIMEKTIRDSAVFYKKHGKGHREIRLNVSPSFVDEYISYMLSAVEINVGHIAERVYSEGRKTLMAGDIIKHFSLTTNGTLAPKEI